MADWNYRVIKRHRPEQGGVTYQVYEVYYLEDGSIDGWAASPVEPLGLSEAQLHSDLVAFLAAFHLPVLEETYRAGRLVLAPESGPCLPRHHLRDDYRERTRRARGYLQQILGNHPLIREHEPLRQAFRQLDQALDQLGEAARLTGIPEAAEP